MRRARHKQAPDEAASARSGEPDSPRQRGGQELPDDRQDRPEQNAGYDQAVHSGPAGTPRDPLMELDADLRTEEPAAEGGLPENIDNQRARLTEIDDRASRRAAAEVRRRERTSR